MSATTKSVAQSNHRSETGPVSRASRAVTHQVEDHPLSTTMIVFGAGLGLGLAIGTMLAETNRPVRSSNSVEAIGQQFLDSITHIVPDAVARRFQG